MNPDYLQITAARLFAEHPYARDFFAALGLAAPERGQILGVYFAGLDERLLDDLGLSRDELQGRLALFLEQMTTLRAGSGPRVESVTVVGGRDKSGAPEVCELVLTPGEVVCIVGPTGSGKSRLLGDIECLAQGDTPTGRRILVNGAPPDPAARFSGEQKLVAQLSQNMNFVMDLAVGEFIGMHAESRLVEDIEGAVARIFATANDLAGERFALETPVTALSGGQSRALMIADVAHLSASPIVLIDEIENAGVDRQRALDLLVRQEKIVLMATHDPILALLGDRRLVIRNGGIAAILETTPAERASLESLRAIDIKLADLRNRLRAGERIESDLQRFFSIQSPSSMR